MSKTILVAALLVVAAFLLGRQTVPQPVSGAGVEQAARAAQDAADDDRIVSAFRAGTGNLPVESGGTVIKLLADDRNGDRHQRFLIELANGHTLLIAHNIDLAPRIDGLRTGDRVDFRGEYEWNAKGGVVHWTHHDPSGRRDGGWLRHAGRTYR